MHVFIHVGAHQAVVNFNARGIAGNITFTELDDGSIRIQSYLRGLRSATAEGEHLSHTVYHIQDFIQPHDNTLTLASWSMSSSFKFTFQITMYYCPSQYL